MGLDGEFRESGLKGTVQYGSPPCTNQLSLAAFEIIFYSFTKQPILAGKSDVLSLPITVCPIYLTVDLMNSNMQLGFTWNRKTFDQLCQRSSQRS